MTGPDRAGRGSLGVPLGALGLVLAVWGALALSARAGESGGPGGDAGTGSITLPASLEGYRADLLFLPDDSTLGFVEIPGGPFTMGSDPRVDRMAFEIERWSPQAFQGTLELPAFRMARTEVTVAQYAAFIRASGHYVLDERALDGAPDHPVRYVAWTDAVAYAAWLDAELRARAGALPPALSELLAEGWRVALPNEAQWEKAARGTDGRIWPWGMEPRADRANFRAAGTTPAGAIPCPECAWGLSDMAGNVWEWTASPYRDYPWRDVGRPERAGQAPDVDLAAPAAWVVRGGGFGDNEQHVRAANRGARDPGQRQPYIGFRVALVPE